MQLLAIVPVEAVVEQAGGLRHRDFREIRNPFETFEMLRLKNKMQHRVKPWERLQASSLKPQSLILGLAAESVSPLEVRNRR